MSQPNEAGAAAAESSPSGAAPSAVAAAPVVAAAAASAATGAAAVASPGVCVAAVAVLPCVAPTAAPAAAVGGAGVGGGPLDVPMTTTAAACKMARTADALDVPIAATEVLINMDVLEWALEADLRPLVAAMAANMPFSVRLAAQLRNDHEQRWKLPAAASSIRLSVLRRAGRAPFASAAELEYAVLFAPMRTAFECVLSGWEWWHKKVPQPIPVVDTVAGRCVPVWHVTSILPVRAADITDGVAACTSAVDSALALGAELSERWMQAGDTAAMVLTRLRGLQMHGSGKTGGRRGCSAGASATEAESVYAKLFEPVREFRHAIQCALLSCRIGDDALPRAEWYSSKRGMWGHGRMPSIRFPPCEELEAAASEADPRITLVGCGGVFCMVASLAAHSAAPSGVAAVLAAISGSRVTSCRAVKRACRAVRDVASAPQMAAHVVAAGGLDAVLTGLETHAHNASVVAAGMFALTSIFRASGTSVSHVARRCVIAANAAFERHAADPKVVNAACTLVGALAAVDADTAGVATGSVPHVVVALVRHVASEDVVVQACCVLYNVCVTDFECLPAILAALRRHTASVHVVTAACMLLCKVYRLLQLHTLVMMSYPSSSRAARAADAANVTSTARGSIPLIVTVLSAHVSSENVAFLATHALEELAACVGSDYFETAGVIPHLCSVLVEHAASRSVVCTVCDLLQHLGLNVGCKGAILESGTVDAIRHARSLHADDEKVTGAADAALERLLATA